VVVTTTRETRVLFLKVRVSVLAPLASVEVVISESPGAERISGVAVVAVLLVVVVATVVVFALEFVVVPESEQPAARLVSASAPNPTISLIRTIISSRKFLERRSPFRRATVVPAPKLYKAATYDAIRAPAPG
jgi:hypothetical protein